LKQERPYAKERRNGRELLDLAPHEKELRNARYL
jgi:hypothetical protein